MARFLEQRIAGLQAENEALARENALLQELLGKLRPATFQALESLKSVQQQNAA